MTKPLDGLLVLDHNTVAGRKALRDQVARNLAHAVFERDIAHLAAIAEDKGRFRAVCREALGEEVVEIV